ncbi:MAG: outer membrane beta-barrel protein [Chitinophagaceae bacterium]
MQDIDQNMDDLFRKAAEQYPLKINESRWDDIAARMAPVPVIKPAVNKTFSKKFIGLVLLFIALLLVGALFTIIPGNNKMQELIHTSPDKKAHSSNIFKNEKTGINNSIAKEDKLRPQTKVNIRPSLPLLTTYSVQHNKERIRMQTKGYTTFGTNRNDPTENFAADINFLEINTPVPGNNTTNNIISQEAEKSDIEEPGEETDVEKEKQIVKESYLKIKVSAPQERGLYFGLIAGPLLDEVKNQGLKKTGFSGGIIAGYQFKNHLAAETGLLFASKPYFSSGKYFSMDKISSAMPAGMQMLSLEGNTRVWELPMKLKYDFLNKNRSNVFISAGITSYLMTYEKNNYLVNMNGSQQTMISSYKNKSRSLVSTFDISVGFEHKTGKSNKIRIEPYIQIPLKGMGVGSMPMISTGLRLGITKFTN